MLTETTGAETTYYQYDTENLMTRIDFPDDTHSYYTYDADSKRVSQRTTDGYSEFIYQGPDMGRTFGSTLLQMERDENGKTKVQYTMGAGLEAMRRADGGDISSGDSSFYHYNHLGTTVALTNAAESVSDTYRHDAWGVRLASTGSTVNPHTYVGRERYFRMLDAGFYHLGFRDYSQRAGRFTTLDPIRDGTNWFAYVANSPSRSVDPRGFSSLLHCCTLSYRAANAAANARNSSASGRQPACRTLNNALYKYVAECVGTQVFIPTPPDPGSSWPHKRPYWIPRLDPPNNPNLRYAYRTWYFGCHRRPPSVSAKPSMTCENTVIKDEWQHWSDCVWYVRHCPADPGNEAGRWMEACRIVCGLTFNASTAAGCYTQCCDQGIDPTSSRCLPRVLPP